MVAFSSRLRYYNSDQRHILKKKKVISLGIWKKMAAVFLILALALSGCARENSTSTLPETTQSLLVSTAPETEPTTLPTEPTTLPTTQPATVPTTQPETEPTEIEPTETEYTGLTIADWSQTVSPGDTGFVTIQGKPGVTYTITVTYKSGPSKAKGLDPQTADDQGAVTWNWKIGSKTSSGTFNITVSGGGETRKVTFQVKSK